MKPILPAVVAVAAIWGPLPRAFAASLEALQGAWLAPGQDCSETFEKRDGEIRFRDRGSSLATGIIVSGNRIVSPDASCTAGRVRSEGDHLSVYLSCSDAVFSSGMSVSFRIIDQDNFERFDTLFPEEIYRYHRCQL